MPRAGRAARVAEEQEGRAAARIIMVQAAFSVACCRMGEL
jgi:hypothetical protein